jgi:hypothetical protein
MCGALTALCSWINMQDDNEGLEAFFKSRSLCILFSRIFANSSELLSDQGVRVELMSLLTALLTPIVTSIRQREGDDYDDDSVLLEVTVIVMTIMRSLDNLSRHITTQLPWVLKPGANESNPPISTVGILANRVSDCIYNRWVLAHDTQATDERTSSTYTPPLSLLEQVYLYYIHVYEYS